jgi:hypothetical protein
VNGNGGASLSAPEGMKMGSSWRTVGDAGGAI